MRYGGIKLEFALIDPQQILVVGPIFQLCNPNISGIYSALKRTIIPYPFCKHAERLQLYFGRKMVVHARE